MIAGSYLDASAIVDFVLSPPEGTPRRLAKIRQLIVLPMCYEAAVRLLDNRQSKPPTQWHEFASAVKHLNEELEKGTDLVRLSLPPGNLEEGRKEAEALAATYQLDIIDALQLQQLKLAFDADPLGTLLTISDDLKEAATREGLKVWNYLRDLEPL